MAFIADLCLFFVQVVGIDGRGERMIGHAYTVLTAVVRCCIVASVGALQLSRRRE